MISNDKSLDITSFTSNMTDEEKEYFTKILDELSLSGKSDTLQSINDADYDEIPVDIITFMTDDDYLGKSLKNDQGELLVYPYWVEFLQNLFNPTNTYVECALSGGIGLGKSTISVIGLAYILYKLLCLKDPVSYYNLVSGSKIAVAILNLSVDQALSVGYRKLQGLLKNSPWFLRNGRIVGREYPTYYPNKNIEIIPGSKMDHFIGRDIFCLSGDTIISTIDGNKRLDEVDTITQVYQYDEDNDQVILSQPTMILPTKVVDEIYEVELEDGTVIRGTGDHKLLTSRGYIEIQNLLDSDDILEVSK